MGKLKGRKAELKDWGVAKEIINRCKMRKFEIFNENDG